MYKDYGEIDDMDIEKKCVLMMTPYEKKPFSKLINQIKKGQA